MNTYKKHKGGGVVMVNQESDKDSCPEEHRDEGPLLGIPVLNPLRAEE